MSVEAARCVHFDWSVVEPPPPVHTRACAGPAEEFTAAGAVAATWCGSPDDAYCEVSEAACDSARGVPIATFEFDGSGAPFICNRADPDYRWAYRSTNDLATVYCGTFAPDVAGSIIMQRVADGALFRAEFTPHPATRSYTMGSIVPYTEAIPDFG